MLAEAAGRDNKNKNRKNNKQLLFINKTLAQPPYSYFHPYSHSQHPVPFRSPPSLYSMTPSIYTKITQVSNKFFESLLPPPPPWLDVMKVCTKLKENGKLVYDDDKESYYWKDWEIKPSEKYERESAYLREYRRSLYCVINSIIGVVEKEDPTLKSKRTLDFRLGGWRKKEISNFDPDAVLYSRDQSDSGVDERKNLIRSTASIPISFVTDKKEELYLCREMGRGVRNIYILLSSPC